MNTFIDLNVVVLPDEKTKKQILSWSRVIAERWKTNFVLDDATYIPHLTLYQTRYPSKNIEQIKNVIRQFALGIKPFKVALSGISAFYGFLFYDAVKEKTLLENHSQLVDLLNPFREGHITEEQQGMLESSEISDAMKEGIVLWGSPVSKDQFIPHITITRLTQMGEAENALSFLKPIEMSFQVSKLYLSNVDHDGTSTKILEEFPLG